MKSIMSFWNDLRDADQNMSTDLFFDVAEDLNLVVFNGSEGSLLVNALSASEENAECAAIDLLAECANIDRVKADEIVHDEGCDVDVYIFDASARKVYAFGDETVEVAIAQFIDRLDRRSSLLAEREQSFYSAHPEYA